MKTRLKVENQYYETGKLNQNFTIQKMNEIVVENYFNYGLSGSSIQDCNHAIKMPIHFSFMFYFYYL